MNEKNKPLGAFEEWRKCFFLIKKKLEIQLENKTISDNVTPMGIFRITRRRKKTFFNNEVVRSHA